MRSLETTIEIYLRAFPFRPSFACLDPAFIVVMAKSHLVMSGESGLDHSKASKQNQYN